MKLHWPAPERNKEPILDVLLRVFPQRGRLLELASGSGQHALHFARAMPGLAYQPTDADPENVASIAAYRAEAQLPNLAAPLLLDVCSPRWPVSEVEAAFNANLVHISPWEAACGLFAGLGRVLRPDGVLALYGPFKRDGAHTADSNARFDASLRAQDPRWGVRDVKEITDLAAEHGLMLSECVAMPANNLTLIFHKSA